MRGEKLSDAIAYEKLNLLRKDFFGYIERHTAKVDTNLPVFYGYVISALESSFPQLSDDAYDEFIDNVTFKVLDVSRNADDIEFIKKTLSHALRFKKLKSAETGIHIVAGLNLVKTGDCIHALEYLKPYATVDVTIGTAVAHCYHLLSLREFNSDNEASRHHRPGEMELLARETMLDLARVQPPVNQLRQLDLDDPSFLEKRFWHMICLALEWFPSEKWFIEIGLRNACGTGNAEMRKRLLKIGSERFYDDIHFLREMYYFNLENRDASGAAGIVSQLMRQYPDDLEPVYLGLKLSLLTTKKITYHSFRKLAVTKGMPAVVIELFDFAFDLLNGDQQEAFNRITDFERDFPQMKYYTTTLRYIAHDFVSIDEARVRRGKKALLDSIDQYCLEGFKKNLTTLEKQS
jgi:hypothetical protein